MTQLTVESAVAELSWRFAETLGSLARSQSITTDQKEHRVQFIGAITRVQVQESSLKVGQPPRRHYDPLPLTTVAALSLIAGGVRGWTAAGEPVEDVHHPNHPHSKNRGENGVSVCFTSHYDAMRERFGAHLSDGIAGENILVDTPHILGEEDLRHGLAIEIASGEIVRLNDVIVATPCVEFTRYAMDFPADARPDRTVSDALQFLNDGMRGYYAAYRGAETRIRPGDRVFVVSGT